MNAPRLKRRSSATEEALKKFVRRQQIELGVNQNESGQVEAHPEKKPEMQYQGACFLYTSAHCSDLQKLKEQAEQLKTIEWLELDIRQPRQFNQEDGWEEVDFLNGDCDEQLPTMRMHEFTSKNSVFGQKGYRV